MNRGNNRKGVHWKLGVLALCLVVLWCTPLMAAPADKQQPDLNGKLITAITLTGNANIAEDVIRPAIRLKPGEKLATEAVRQDLQGIYELGYFYDVAAQFTVVPEGVKVNYHLSENPILKGIVIKGNTKLTTEKIMSLMTVAQDKVLNSVQLNDSAAAIEQTYHDQGYVLSKVSDLNMSPIGILTVSINEGTLEGIRVKGNKKTKTYVITREMKLKTGEPFNANTAKRAMQKVYNLGYFEDVNMKLNPGREPNAVVLEAEVIEQRTGTFSIGGGYSKSDGLVGILELGDNNFKGTGDKVKAHWEFGGNGSNRNWEFGYTRPWLDSKETSLGVNFYNYTNEYNEYDGGNLLSTYDRKRQGWDITLGRPKNEFTRNYVTLKNRIDKYIAPVSGIDYSNDADYKARNFGTTRSIILAQTFDNRDNVIEPTEGRRTNLSGEFAGRIAGGDFKFNKYTYETRNYKKVGRKHVLAFKSTFGLATGNLPDSQRYALGGAETLRGYEDDEYKGNKLIATTVEYRFPLAQKVSGVVFTDAGKIWDGTGTALGGIKYSVGFGIRLTTPLGPIRLDYGRGKEGGRSHFSFGGQF